jgi:hypothetical protein
MFVRLIAGDPAHWEVVVGARLHRPGRTRPQCAVTAVLAGDARRTRSVSGGRPSGHATSRRLVLPEAGQGRALCDATQHASAGRLMIACHQGAGRSASVRSPMSHTGMSDLDRRRRPCGRPLLLAGRENRPFDAVAPTGSWGGDRSTPRSRAPDRSRPLALRRRRLSGRRSRRPRGRSLPECRFAPRALGRGPRWARCRGRTACRR